MLSSPTRAPRLGGRGSDPPLAPRELITGENHTASAGRNEEISADGQTHYGKSAAVARKPNLFYLESASNRKQIIPNPSHTFCCSRVCTQRVAPPASAPPLLTLLCSPNIAVSPGSQLFLLTYSHINEFQAVVSCIKYIEAWNAANT